MYVEWIITERKADQPEPQPSRHGYAADFAARPTKLTITPDEISAHNLGVWLCLVCLFFGFLAGLALAPGGMR